MDEVAKKAEKEQRGGGGEGSCLTKGSLIKQVGEDQGRTNKDPDFFRMRVPRRCLWEGGKGCWDRRAVQKLEPNLSPAILTLAWMNSSRAKLDKKQTFLVAWKVSQQSAMRTSCASDMVHSGSMVLIVVIGSEICLSEITKNTR